MATYPQDGAVEGVNRGAGHAAGNHTVTWAGFVGRRWGKARHAAMLAPRGCDASMRRVDARPLFDPRTRLALLAMGFASGLPAELLLGTLQIRLSEAGIKPREIGLLALITLPAMLKPVWAPLVDRWNPGMGRRRGWMMLALTILAPTLALLGWLDPKTELGLLIVVASIAAMASATLDLAVNGFTCDVVEARSAAAGAGLSVWGYRTAALASSFAALWLAREAGWGCSYLTMGVAAAVCLVPVLLTREPQRSANPPASLGDALTVPVRAFVAELGLARLVVILVFALLFRLADSWAGNQTGTFLSLRGFDTGDIGMARGPVALVAAGVGVLAAGWLGARWSVGWCLLLAGILGAGSNLVFVALDQGMLEGRTGLMAAIAIEAGCSGFMSAIFVGFLIRLCGSSCAATQYALLTAVWLLGRFLTAPAGLLAESQGWSSFFAWSAAAGLPGLALIPLVVGRPRANA
jgi:PAT family beta-lactamase induction signal transducer AmpG